MENEENENDEQANFKKSFIKLCHDISIDDMLRDEAWVSFQQINRNVTLEGDPMHWLVCSLYVTCRKSALIKEQLSINTCQLPLSRIINTAKLSLLQFFRKLRKWIDMGSQNNILNKQIEQLERNFSVSSIVYEKYLVIFKDLYLEGWTEPVKRGRGAKKHALTTKDIFNFCWTLYIRAKAQYPDISDDLVNSYHLLLCCLDLIFSNTLTSKPLKSAANPDFKGLPSGYLNQEFPDGPSILDGLCQLYEGLTIETKIIRRQYLRSFLEDLIKQNNLKGSIDKKVDLLDSGNFEYNTKYLNDSYEKHILQRGDIDERIFIKDDAPTQIGTPTKRVTVFTDEDEKERSQVKRNLQEYFNKVKGFVPQTPFTGKRWLDGKSASPGSDESPSITSSAYRLQELVKGLKPSPSENLKSMFESCNENPEESLKSSLNQLSSVFLDEYTKPLENCLPSKSELKSETNNIDFAKARLHLAIVLFYKILENFLVAEKKKSTADLSTLLQQQIFIKCLFACCLEIVIYSYNSSRVFPWVIKIFDLKPYFFFKVIELVIRGEDLSRGVIKHLSRIEEQCLETLSWKSKSPIHESIKSHGVPKCQEVAADSSSVTPWFFMSPTTIRMSKDGNVHQSPIASLKERFATPPGSPARRNLFGSPVKIETPPASVSNTNNKHANTVVLPPKTSASPLSSVRFPIMLTSPGSSPVRLYAVTPQRGTPPRAGVIRIQASPNKTNSKKYGSLGIFFRKLYHMSSLRLKDLCVKLGIGNELQKKIWTCFEHNLVEDIDMLRDRHIDQLLMCAVYVMCKVTKEDKSFHDIMKFYRMQPQATSDIYRCVLVKRDTKLDQNTGDEKTEVENDNVKREEMEDLKEAPKETAFIKKEEDVSNNRDNNDDNEENRDIYNDLIQFYNIVYIKKIKDFALKFASNKVTLDAPPLSPLPVSRKQAASPRQVSKQHQIYISPIKPATQMTPRSKMLYCFDSDSPKKLNEINAMIKGGTRRKVILDLDEENGPTLPKRPMNGLAKRAQELRHEQLNQRVNNHK